MRGGAKVNLKPAAATQGTEIEVKELFFNTPARKKFLKSNTTEINQILNTFVPYTLLHYTCRFLLIHQGKKVIDLAPAGNLKQRLCDALNLESKYLLEAEQDFTRKGVNVHMILGDINIKRTRRDLQFLFVNGRPVQNKAISFHLNQIYRLIMARDEFPFFAVYVNMPAKDLDVNIHPTKREVKIKYEMEICSYLRSM